MKVRGIVQSQKTNKIRALNNDARAAFVAHNRAEQAMNAPISLHFAKLNALESSTRHLLAECEEEVTKGISQFYEAFRVEREEREIGNGKLGREDLRDDFRSCAVVRANRGQSVRRRFVFRAKYHGTRNSRSK